MEYGHLTPKQLINRFTSVIYVIFNGSRVSSYLVIECTISLFIPRRQSGHWAWCTL